MINFHTGDHTMAASRQDIVSSHEKLLMAIQNETRKFQEYYVWLEKAMPQNFFDEISQDNMMLIAHSLMGFPLQDYFSTIHLRRAAIVICLDSADADLLILKNYAMYGIKSYETFISETPPPFPGITAKLRVAMIYFTEAVETVEKAFPFEKKVELKALVKERNPDLTDKEFEELISGINTLFLRSMPTERMALALDMYFRAKTRDNCQYEVRYNQEWETNDLPSMQVVLAWKNTPKNNFLYHIAQVIHRHGLFMKRVNSTYLDAYTTHSIQVMVLGLHGSNGQAVWDVAEIPDFLRELVTVKYFDNDDIIDSALVSKKVISGNMGNLLRCMNTFIHQALVHIDVNLYTPEKIEEALCRHPELIVTLCESFKRKFDPDYIDLEIHEQMKKKFIQDVEKIDTGNEENDTMRKAVLKMGMSFVENTLKTNFYRLNFTAYSFRLDPKYLDEIPFDRSKKFPELPFGIFFIRGMQFFGFHIRFKDLSRGGLRTVFPEHPEVARSEQNNVFTECYNLAYTQQQKNKDIPEGGSKGIVFIQNSSRIEIETKILLEELTSSKIDPEEVEKKVQKYRLEQQLEFMYQAQRSFIESLLTIINCEPDGKLRAKYIIDYWNRPEYIYLGPDENMHDVIIQWIADISVRYKYKAGGSFISSKPSLGINHKEYGVTSLGVHVYLQQVLKFLGIDPETQPFTIKISGGPDGDVAGNELLNLYHSYPKTAKLVALTDISGTIFDPEGLELEEMVKLFKKGQPIRYYPPQLLHNGGYLLDRFTKRNPTKLTQETLCYRKTEGKVVEEWLPGNEMNSLWRHNLHKAKADVFIPAGGRPKTLSDTTYKDFLDETGKPTSRAIVEGANLYLTPKARRNLEKLGVLIIKDSSANKCGVICSSFEVLSGLTLGDQEFVRVKSELVKEILERLSLCALNEATLLLKTHKETGEFLTDISEKISERINQFTYQLLDYLETTPLPKDPKDPILQAYLDYCLPILRNNYQEQLLTQIPEHHKKAIIACHIASQLVYKRGLSWFPSIVDILPILLRHESYER